MALIDPSKLPTDKEIASKLIDTEARSKQRELEVGILGKIFGNKETAQFNITGFVLIILVLFLVIFTSFANDTETLTKKDVLIFILPIITSIIGFFIGNNKNKKE